MSNVEEAIANGDKPRADLSLHPSCFLAKARRGAAVCYLKSEHNKAYEDAVRTQEAI